MKIETLFLEGVLVIEPQVFGDARGFFQETYQQRRYTEAGIDAIFVQDNVSLSTAGILRGLHFQYPAGQAKLVYVLSGSVYDVVVDIRAGSPTFGRWVGTELSADNHRQVFVPAGFAHGFCVLSDRALFAYKCSDYYNPAAEGGIAWNDPALAIDWPVERPLVSEKDRQHPVLSQWPADRLPVYTP